MSEAKTFASLSSGLLARKGGAKPAMRPQAFGQVGASLDDLGWNDMGHSSYDHAPTPTPAAGLTPAPKAVSEPATKAVPEPVVVEQQRTLEAHYAPAPVAAPMAPAPRAPKSRPSPAPAKSKAEAPIAAKAKAAFTLRLDAERHLKLRLACALTRRSAQSLVTAALDEFLDSLPEVEALARRVPADAGKRRA